MIGILIISHCDIGKELIKATELIIGHIEAVDSISITQPVKSEELIRLISQKIKELDKGDGVLILTDMFGGTPCNISLPFLEKEKVEVLAGVNLPMLIAVAKDREGMSLEELSRKAAQAGKKSITLAGEILSS